MRDHEENENNGTRVDPNLPYYGKQTIGSKCSAPDNPPAFPLENTENGFEGMDLRDYFAAKALVGILSGSIHEHYSAKEFAATVASDAYHFADEMLRIRSL